MNNDNLSRHGADNRSLNVGRDLRSITVMGGGAEAKFGDVVDQKVEIHLHIHIAPGAKVGPEEQGKIADVGRQILSFLSPILGKRKEDPKQIES